MITMRRTRISRMLLKTAFAFFAALLLVCAAAAQSEDTPPMSPGVSVDASKKSPLGATGITTEENSGILLGDYLVKQTAEFGGRITSNSGNLSMWDSYVDLGTGPRLLEYSLSMHSTTHKSMLFDDLSFNNFPQRLQSFAPLRVLDCLEAAWKPLLRAPLSFHAYTLCIESVSALYAHVGPAGKMA